MIIGLSGRAGSGKDTVADRLVTMHGFKAISIAKPLKDAASILFDINRDAMDDRELKETIDPRYGVSPRTILQNMGTEYIRNQFGGDFLIKRALSDAKKFTDDHQNVVITDVRFGNEAQGIMDTGHPDTHIWSINADKRIIGGSCLTGDSAKHVSEKPLDTMIPLTEIDNNGTLHDLYRKIDKIAMFYTQP
jgi:hypothetical protein